MQSAYLRLRTRGFLFLIGLRNRMTLGVRTAVLAGDDRVLLVRHTYFPGWHFPGGGIDPGENAVAAARREVLEETGHVIEGTPALFGFFHNVTPASVRDHIAFYVARDQVPGAPFRPSREIAEAAWFPRDRLPAGVTSGTVARLREIFDGAPVAVEWGD